MNFKIANVQDIEKVLKLHFRYQVDSIKQEDKKGWFCNNSFYKRAINRFNYTRTRIIYSS